MLIQLLLAGAVWAQESIPEVIVIRGGSWGPLSAEVKASYAQTSTREEVNSVTFSEESTFTDTYAVQTDSVKTSVYGLWQLVDAVRSPIHLLPSLINAEIPAIVTLEFPNGDVIYQSVTKF